MELILEQITLLTAVNNNRYHNILITVKKTVVKNKVIIRHPFNHGF